MTFEEIQLSCILITIQYFVDIHKYMFSSGVISPRTKTWSFELVLMRQLAICKDDVSTAYSCHLSSNANFLSNRDIKSPVTS